MTTGLQAVLDVTVRITGQGDVFQLSAELTNTSAAPTGGLALQAGNVTVQAPAAATGCVVNGIALKAPANSTNVKTIKGIAGDTGVGPWTAGPVVIPCAAGATFVIVSTSPELIEGAWF